MAKIRKALVAAGVAASTAVATAAQDGTLTREEWLTAVLAAAVAGYAVWRVPNRPPAPPEA